MTTSLQSLHNWPFIMFRSTYRKLKGTKSKQIISGFLGTLQIWATTPERVDIQQQSCKDSYVSDLMWRPEIYFWGITKKLCYWAYLFLKREVWLLLLQQCLVVGRWRPLVALQVRLRLLEDRRCSPYTCCCHRRSRWGCHHDRCHGRCLDLEGNRCGATK